MCREMRKMPRARDLSVCRYTYLFAAEARWDEVAICRVQFLWHAKNGPYILFAMIDVMSIFAYFHYRKIELAEITDLSLFLPHFISLFLFLSIDKREKKIDIKRKKSAFCALLWREKRTAIGDWEEGKTLLVIYYVDRFRSGDLSDNLPLFSSRNRLEKKQRWKRKSHVAAEATCNCIIFLFLSSCEHNVSDVSKEMMKFPSSFLITFLF